LRAAKATKTADGAAKVPKTAEGAAKVPKIPHLTNSFRGRK